MGKNGIWGKNEEKTLKENGKNPEGKRWNLERKM